MTPSIPRYAPQIGRVASYFALEVVPLIISASALPSIFVEDAIRGMYPYEISRF